MARTKNSSGMRETQTPSRTEHNKSSVRFDSEKTSIKRPARIFSNGQKTAEGYGNDSEDLERPYIKRMKRESSSSTSVPTNVPASSVRGPKPFRPESMNIALQLSAGCRIGPKFDETKILSLPNYDPLPYPEMYTRIVQDLIRCALRPEEVIAVLKFSAPGEPSTIITVANRATGTFACKNIPVVEDVDSAQAWLQEWLESLGCCKRLFLPDYLADQFICKPCFEFNQGQRRGVAASGDDAASERRASQIERENDEERKRKEAEEEGRKRIEEEKRKVADEEKEKRVQEERLKQRVLKEHEKKEAEKKRKEEEGRRKIAELKREIAEEEKQKRIEDKKMNERLIQKQKKEAEKKRRAREEELRRIEAERRKAEEKAKREEEERKRKEMEKKETERLNKLEDEKKAEEENRNVKKRMEEEAQMERYNYIHSVFLVLFKIPEERAELRPDLKNTLTPGSPDVSFTHDVRVNIYNDGGQEMWQLADQKAMDSSILKEIKSHSCQGHFSPVKFSFTMLDMWQNLLLHCHECIDAGYLLKGLERFECFMRNERMRKEAIGRQDGERRRREEEEKQKAEEEKRKREENERAEKRELYNNMNAFFFFHFKLPEGRTELRPDLGNPVVSNCPDLSLMHMVRSNSFRHNGKELWQLGDQRPMDSSVLKAIASHSCPTRHSSLDTQGTLLDLWHGLLLHCPECINERSLKDALDKVREFIEVECKEELIFE